MLVVSDSCVLPLLDHQHDGSECVRKRKRRVLKVASRCQVRINNRLPAFTFPTTPCFLFEGGQSESQHSDGATSCPSRPSVRFAGPSHQQLCSQSRYGGEDSR